MTVFFTAENPPGTFQGLQDGETYWVYVSQDDEEERKDRERMKKVYLIRYRGNT